MKSCDTLLCEELVGLCRHRNDISYSCHIVLLKPIQKLFPSWGNEKQPREVVKSYSQSESP